MARLKKKLFGNISGAFGDAVFRQIGTTNYIAQKPASYKKPDTQGFRERTIKFSLAVKLAKNINRVNDLKKIWKTEFPTVTRLFNFLVQKNYGYITADGISSNPRITPDENSFKAIIISNTVTSGNINVKIQALNNIPLLNPEFDKKIKLISIILLADPVDKNKNAFELITIQSDAQVLILSEVLTFDIDISQTYGDLIQNYNSKKVFSALITLDDNNLPVNRSTTFFSS
ncbi:hypothetical protein [Ignavibacterium sp.]|uniref:hypothetical protein n=1 Tax=Ignavibacterium sp. TaxID=2651167 RepID=UPI0021FDE9B2|nr:hypothetical protein [Ignavibacterium sp.]BDQ02793.1 MAG: hypothetical protein KatS3mg037_1368 [Ignavibacterium sp.]